MVVLMRRDKTRVKEGDAIRLEISKYKAIVDCFMLAILFIVLVSMKQLVFRITINYVLAPKNHLRLISTKYFERI